MKLTRPIKGCILLSNFPEWKKNLVKLSWNDICISRLDPFHFGLSNTQISYFTVATGNIIEKLAAYENIHEDPAWVADAIAQYRSVCAKSCNSCGRAKTCKYVPEWGQPVRYNCPFYEEQQEGGVTG